MSDPMFTIEERDRVRDRVLAIARSDSRVVAGAAVGSLAIGPGDTWSDLDLTFGLADGVPAVEVLADWTKTLREEFGAAHLLDVPFRSSIYRVFLLPGNLQVDLSFTPGAEFGALGPRFHLLFGEVVERPPVPPPSSRDLFGLGALYALHARSSIERGRFLQAEHWIHQLRDQALSLACLRRGLPSREGRGYDELPAETKSHVPNCLPRSLERDELLRALRSSIEALLRETEDARDLALEIESGLRRLGTDSHDSLGGG